MIDLQIIISFDSPLHNVMSGVMPIVPIYTQFIALFSGLIYC